MPFRYEEIMKIKNFLPFKMISLTPDMIEKARSELGETDENRTKCIKELRERLLAEKDINPTLDDAFMLQYLRARKFDVDRAFNLIMQFYKVKRDHGEIYDDFTPEQCEQVRYLFRKDHAAVLPYRDQEGCAVIIFRLGDWDPKVLDMLTVMQAMTLLVLYTVQFAASQVCGVHILIDVKGCGLKHVRALTPYYLHLFSKALRNCLPVRFKGIQVFNESVIFQYIWSVLKIFLSEKINKRVHFHGDSLKSLHKQIPKAILPEFYGGDNKNFKNSEWAAKEVEGFYETFHGYSKTGYNK